MGYWQTNRILSRGRCSRFTLYRTIQESRLLRSSSGARGVHWYGDVRTHESTGSLDRCTVEILRANAYEKFSSTEGLDGRQDHSRGQSSTTLRPYSSTVTLIGASSLSWRSADQCCGFHSGWLTADMKRGVGWVGGNCFAGRTNAKERIGNSWRGMAR